MLRKPDETKDEAVLVEKTQDNKNEDLWNAVKSNKCTEVKLALKKGANPDHTVDGWSMLAYAVFYDMQSVVKELLYNGPNFPNPDQPIKHGRWIGWTLLKYALHNNYSATAYHLVKKGAYKEGQEDNSTSWSHLTYAVYYYMTDVVKLLLNKNAKVNVRFPNQSISDYWGGWSLLGYAIYQKQCEVSSLLLDKGAVVHTNNVEETFPRSLLSAYSGWPYLAYAVYHHLVEYDLIKKLIMNGANAKGKFTGGAIDNISYTEYAEKKGWINIAEMLSSPPVDRLIDTKKRLPIGQSHFPDLIRDKCEYIDKSLFIKNIIEDPHQIKIFTRPSRCGKSLNLSMLSDFFDRGIESKIENYFEDLLISKYFNIINIHQSAYTVIHISLKALSNDDQQLIRDKFFMMLSNLYKYFERAISHLNEDEKKYFELIKTCHLPNRKASDEHIKLALKNLIIYINKQYNNTKVVILIDEYDAPFQRLLIENNPEKRKEIICTADFIMLCLNEALKEKDLYFQAICMGIFPLDLSYDCFNRPSTAFYSIANNEYSSFFGYSENEVAEICLDEKIEDSLESAKAWCAYSCGSLQLYNPGLFNMFAEMAFAKKNTEVFLSAKDVLEYLLSNSFIKNNVIKEMCENNLSEAKSIQSKISNKIDILKNEFKNDKEEGYYLCDVLLACGFLSIIFPRISELDSLKVSNLSALQLYKKLSFYIKTQLNHLTKADTSEQLTENPLSSDSLSSTLIRNEDIPQLPEEKKHTTEENAKNTSAVVTEKIDSHVSVVVANNEETASLGEKETVNMNINATPQNEETPTPSVFPSQISQTLFSDSKNKNVVSEIENNQPHFQDSTTNKPTYAAIASTRRSHSEIKVLNKTPVKPSQPNRHSTFVKPIVDKIEARSSTRANNHRNKKK